MAAAWGHYVPGSCQNSSARSPSQHRKHPDRRPQNSGPCHPLAWLPRRLGNNLHPCGAGQNGQRIRPRAHSMGYLPGGLVLTGREIDPAPIRRWRGCPQGFEICRDTHQDLRARLVMAIWAESFGHSLLGPWCTWPMAWAEPKGRSMVHGPTKGARLAP